ncbi:MAG: superoxide dismutase family protein [Cyclobacteriaceae bacterium]
MPRFFLIFCIILAIGCQEQNTLITTARVDFYGLSIDENTSQYTLEATDFGEAFLKEEGNLTTIRFELKNLAPNNEHALHIHTGDCGEPQMHWNMNSTESSCNRLSNGEVWARPMAGDIGNALSNDSGESTIEFTSEFWSLQSGDRNISGLPIVIHQSGEDFAQECFEQHKHLHSNTKIACGVITINNQ